MPYMSQYITHYAREGQIYVRARKKYVTCMIYQFFAYIYFCAGKKEKNVTNFFKKMNTYQTLLKNLIKLSVVIFEYLKERNVII